MNENDVSIGSNIWSSSRYRGSIQFPRSRASNGIDIRALYQQIMYQETAVRRTYKPEIVDR